MSDGKGSQAQARVLKGLQNDIHTFGDLTTRLDFPPSLGYSQSKKKSSYVESSLVRELFFTAAYEN